jgi:cell division protein FtsQ
MARVKRRGTPSSVAQDTTVSAAIKLLWVLVLLVGSALTLDWLLRSDNFPVEHVHFEGSFEHVTRVQLVETVKDHVRGNFFALDLSAMVARIEALPWVYRASVRRRWPRDLHVAFSEQQLVARWGNDARLNHVGELVNVPNAVAEPALPALEGPSGTHRQVLQSYREFAHILASSGLHPVAVTLTSRRTWRIRLKNNLTLVLAREDPWRRLARFVQVYARGLAAHERSIKQIDLRYTNGLSVQWLDPPARPLQAEFVRAH